MVPAAAAASTKEARYERGVILDLFEFFMPGKAEQNITKEAYVSGHKKIKRQIEWDDVSFLSRVLSLYIWYCTTQENPTFFIIFEANICKKEDIYHWPLGMTGDQSLVRPRT